MQIASFLPEKVEKIVSDPVESQFFRVFYCSV